MFTRRALFKMLAAIGAGSLLPAVGENGMARFSGIGEGLAFDSSAQPRDSRAKPGEQAVEVSGIEQWEDLLDDLDAVELIGRYISLRPTGDESRNSKGPCPFCRQGADSLLVDGRDDSYFCTDCLAGGHALDFYARIEGLSLSESVRSVRRLMESGVLQGKRPRLKRFQCIIDEINRFAHESLIHGREGVLASSWIDRQGVTAETAEHFSLGIMSYALAEQLRERLFAMGCSKNELEQFGVEGWISCMEDRMRDGALDLALLLPLRNAEGCIYGFYEQGIEDAAGSLWSGDFLPYGFKLLFPRQAGRLVFSNFDPRDSARAVVLVGRPWDVVLLAQGGMDHAVYVSPLDLADCRDRLGRFLMCARKIIWPVHRSEVNVGFVRNLLSLSDQSIGRLAFMLLPEGERLPELLRREGLAAIQTCLAGAVPLKALLWV